MTLPSSSNRILTTHTGSLPRPADVLEMLHSGERGEAFAEAAARGVAATVARQAEVGIDIVNDGEVSKPGFATYVTERLGGFESQERQRAEPVEKSMFPEFYASLPTFRAMRVMTCVGPVVWKGDDQVQRDIDNLKAAVAGTPVEGVFVSSASPGTVWYYQPNAHYATHEEYVMAVADAMKHEYDALHRAGFLVQLDCPDLAGGWNRPESRDFTVDDFRAFARLHIEALNHATRDIPPERLRMHVCWGNYAGPHVRDIPLADIIDLLLDAHPAAISFEGANPRHEHEWQLFSDIDLPEGKVLMPGVIDSTTNYVEHPELVAQRIGRYAEAVGPENVIAGCDCGFATLGDSSSVHPEVTWAKLGSLVEGARLASARL
jgi:5-methyltetrahydropteroyltriglutamate--homocysteine methyltransferase